jgi:zinc/manganese transport system substrate-binding protein
MTPGAGAADTKLSVVAAENVYGDIVRQIGGDRVEVTSILSNPDQDPHLFETTPSVARRLAAARIVVLNGAGYDPWLPPLLAAQPTAGRKVIVVADLIGGNRVTIRISGMTRHAARARGRWRRTPPPIRPAPPIRSARDAPCLMDQHPQPDRRISREGGGAPVTASEPVFGTWPKRLA